MPPLLMLFGALMPDSIASTVDDLGGSDEVVVTALGDLRVSTIRRVCAAKTVVIGTVVASTPESAVILTKSGVKIPTVESAITIDVERTIKGDSPSSFVMVVRGGSAGGRTVYSTNPVWPKPD